VAEEVVRMLAPVEQAVQVAAEMAVVNHQM
jgi:hypothetical protein